jgi:hypothetical protein
MSKHTLHGTWTPVITAEVKKLQLHQEDCMRKFVFPVLAP